jgi:hypothetical protein
MQGMYASKGEEISGTYTRRKGGKMSKEPSVKAKMELPRYRCHKEVRAGRITGIQEVFLSEGFGTGVLMDLHLEGGWVRVPVEWMERHEPKVGGYYVVYKDGYTSYSPAEAFEEGYTRI